MTAVRQRPTMMTAALVAVVAVGVVLNGTTEAFSRSSNSNKKQQQQQQQQKHKYNVGTIDFSSKGNHPRRSLQEFEITQTMEGPMLISETAGEMFTDETRVTTVYNSSEIPSGTPADVVIYGCTPAGLFTALRLLEPDVTQDTIREDVVANSVNGDGTLSVIIMEPSDRCGGRLLTAEYYDETFLAELGDMGYYSSSKAYADVLMEYLNLDTKMVQTLVLDPNLLYLRGNYLRGNQSPLTLSEIYRMNFIERGQTASDLLMHAVDMLLPGAFDYNETEWMQLFMEASMIPSEEDMMMKSNQMAQTPYTLTKIGFWNALSLVLSNEAVEFVSTYFEDSLVVKSNMNALEAIVCVVMMVNSYEGPTAGGGMKSPVLGMEAIAMELQQRVLDLGGLIALNSVMTDLILNNVTDTEDVNATSTYDVSFIVGEDQVDLTEVGNVIFATEYDSSDMSTAGGVEGALTRVMLSSEFFAVEEQDLNATISVVVNDTLTNTTTMSGADSRMNMMYFEPVLTLQNALMARVPIEYARVYVCYETPWWNTPALGIKSGRSVTDLPINTVQYFTSDACLAVCSSGPGAAYWKHLAAGTTGSMFMSASMKQEFSTDFSVWETRWDELAAATPAVIVDEVHRQLKLLHNLQYIPSAKSAVYVSDDIVGDTQRLTVPGINPDRIAEYMMKPKAEWNVFFVGESYGVGFPYQGLEADLASAENLVQVYFFNQPEPLTFDSTGELTSEELTQTGLAISTSADGSRIAVVSSSQEDALKGEVTVYQRIGDEFLGLWKRVGTNFVSDSTAVDLRDTTGSNETDVEVEEEEEEEIVEEEEEIEVPVANETDIVANETEVVEEEIVEEEITTNTTDLGNTTNATRYRTRSLRQIVASKHTKRRKRRKLVERTEMANMTSVALSGDGRIMAIGVVDAESGIGSVQLWMDASMDASVGNWTKLGSELISEDAGGEGEFGFAIDLSYDGSILAVGAPSRDEYGAVIVYDCSMLTKANPNDLLQGAANANDAAGQVPKDIRETFAPATGLLSGFDSMSSNGVGSSSMNGGSSSSTSRNVGTCIQMGKTMEGIDLVTRYGESVSLSYDGRAVAAGAPNTGTEQVGYVSVFSYSQETSDWSQAGNLIAGIEGEDQFGFSVSLSADARHVAIGAPGSGTSQIGAGYVRVYTFGVTTDLTTDEFVLDWMESGAYDGDGESGDNVGFSVALSGDAMRLIVGAPQLESGGNGFVVALMQDFDNPGNWTLYEDTDEIFLGTDTGDHMGYSVATDYEGSNIALGAPQATSGQGLVKTFVFVEPPPEEPLTTVSEDSATAMARLIWADAQVAESPYPWADEDPCVEGAAFMNPDDPVAAVNALAETMTIALEDTRLTSEVEQALVINMDANDPMIVEMCTPLLDAANLLAVDESLDITTRVLLDRAITAYEDSLGTITEEIPVEEIKPEVPEVPVFNETDFGNATDTNSTDVFTPPTMEGIMPPVEGFNETVPVLPSENRTRAGDPPPLGPISVVGGSGGRARHRGEGRRRERIRGLRR